MYGCVKEEGRGNRFYWILLPLEHFVGRTKGVIFVSPARVGGCPKREIDRGGKLKIVGAERELGRFEDKADMLMAMICCVKVKSIIVF